MLWARISASVGNQRNFKFFSNKLISVTIQEILYFYSLDVNSYLTEFLEEI